ncbi:hypothetical protein J6590_062000 [Homalodisca vitripennis]|nr:hypothetical protein J6590_062000 [Homalodisca vitripennis]
MRAQPCPLCPKIISNKSNLLKHMRIRHTDEYNPAYCMLCNKLFKNKYSLRAHINIYHKFMLNSVLINLITDPSHWSAFDFQFRPRNTIDWQLHAGFEAMGLLGGGGDNA